MSIPFVIDNQDHRLADALNELLTQSVGKPVDVATAYFAISGYRVVKETLHSVGAFKLLLGAEPGSGADVGFRPNPEALKKRLEGDLEAEPFNRATLKLVEELIAFLRADKVEVRLYDKGFLHAAGRRPSSSARPRCGRCGSGSWPAPPSPPRSSAWKSWAATPLTPRPTATPTSC